MSFLPGTVRIFNDENIGQVLVIQRVQRARTEYTCADCGKPIAKGERHLYMWSIVDHVEGSSVGRYHLGECCEYLP